MLAHLVLFPTGLALLVLVGALVRGASALAVRLAASVIAAWVLAARRHDALLLLSRTMALFVLPLTALMFAIVVWRGACRRLGGAPPRGVNLSPH